MLKELEKLRQEKVATLPQRLAIRVLEIDKDKLFFYDASRDKDRRWEVTKDNVAKLIEDQKNKAGDKELYFLIVPPRRESGFSGYPLAEQRRDYDRWFQNVAHSYSTSLLIYREGRPFHEHHYLPKL